MFGRFFLPGPTEVHPDVLAAQQQAMIGHRGAGMSAMLAEADPILRRVFRTSRPVYISSSSATAQGRLSRPRPRPLRPPVRSSSALAAGTR